MLLIFDIDYGLDDNRATAVVKRRTGRIAIFCSTSALKNSWDAVVDSFAQPVTIASLLKINLNKQVPMRP